MVISYDTYIQCIYTLYDKNEPIWHRISKYAISDSRFIQLIEIWYPPPILKCKRGSKKKKNGACPSTYFAEPLVFMRTICVLFVSRHISRWAQAAAAINLWQFFDTWLLIIITSFLISLFLSIFLSRYCSYCYVGTIAYSTQRLSRYCTIIQLRRRATNLGIK